ncbi:TlpA family protein disulfide reductase [Planctopirus ephydatiae]|nr:TlpA disulfide reductase family protein [Planctopirus ephydatiae]
MLRSRIRWSMTQNSTHQPSMSTNFGTWPVVAGKFVFAVALMAGSQFSAMAQEAGAPPAAAAKPAPQDPLKQEEVSDALYAIPKGSADDILEFLEDLQQKRPRLKSRQQAIEHAIRVQKTIIEGTGQVLAMPKVELDTAVEAAEMHLQAHTLLASAQIDGAQEAALAAATKLKADTRKEISELANQQLLMLRVLSAPTLTAQERATLSADILKAIETTKYSEESIGMGMQLAMVLESMPETGPAVDFLGDLANLLDKADKKEIKQAAEQVRGMARRINLPGNTMVLKGTTVDGKPFDLASLKGKVVLVDFWATWCGPCIAEMPNLKKAYEAYHDKGFEVVGVSLDDSKEDLMGFLKEKNVPWITLFHEGTEEAPGGWSSPQAAYYGISGIPTCILINAEGKVISLEARGENLTNELAKLLGPVKEEPKDETTDDAPAKKK